MFVSVFLLLCVILAIRALDVHNSYVYYYVLTIKANLLTIDQLALTPLADLCNAHNLDQNSYGTRSGFARKINQYDGLQTLKVQQRIIVYDKLQN